MLCRELLLALLILRIKSNEDARPYNVLEGEPHILKHYLPLSAHGNETAIIKWSRCSQPLGWLELNSRSFPRIILHDYVLEFWPVELNDQGVYCSQMGNVTQKHLLKVIKRNNHSCFSETRVTSQNVTVKKSLMIKCTLKDFEKWIYRTSLYKEKIEENNKSLLMVKNAEFKDQGYYSCVFSLLHNGKLYNLTNTYNVAVLKDHTKRIPVLLGPKINYVEVEIGENIELYCSALASKDDTIYWSFQTEKKSIANAYENETETWTSAGKEYVSRILKIEKVNEDNIGFSCNCTVGNAGGMDTQSFILVRKETTDIPNHVFTRGMIISVLMSVAAVCLVVFCVIYRVDLVLFYRHLVGRDETLTDGKTYDAFVSYLKVCHSESGEEYTFAVETLPKVLEKRFGYKLCIFERDVLPGGAVADEIHSLIERSRRIIIVLSKGYMSNEVMYELESGLHEALVERKIKIILIEFSPVSDSAFFPQSLKLLKSHRVLKWKADEPLSYNSRFWKNLLYLMPAKAPKPGQKESEVLSVHSVP
ncbi:interleukin-18 receptor 1 [Thomomys bottae]